MPGRHLPAGWLSNLATVYAGTRQTDQSEAGLLAAAEHCLLMTVRQAHTIGEENTKGRRIGGTVQCLKSCIAQAVMSMKVHMP